MARRRQQAGRDARRDARPRATATQTKLTDGQVVGEQDKADAYQKLGERMVARLSKIHAERNPRWKELRDEPIRLRGNDAQMKWGIASGSLDALREIQQEAPDDFAALVAMVKPRGATRLPAKGSPENIAGLTNLSMLNPDGSPASHFAAMLDAAYEETSEGVVLRDPMIYSREFVEKWKPVVDKVEREVEAARRITRKEQRKLRGNDEGPMR